MRKRILPCACLALTLLSACKEDRREETPETAAIGAVHDMSADFSAYQTFNVVEPADIPATEAAPTSYLEANWSAVVQSIIREMEARGYVRDQAHPDLLISPQIRLDDVEVQAAQADQAQWYDYYYGWYWGYAYPWYEDDLVLLDVGTLVIDAVDLGERENIEDDALVFRGYARALMPSQPDDASERISAAVAEIYTHWPDVTR